MPRCIIKLLLCFFLCFHIHSTSAQTCRTSCSGNGVYDQFPTIRFPFGLKDTANSRCGYPDFTLLCDTRNRTLLSLPNSAQFLVHDIDYLFQEITIDDPNSCIGGRILDGSLNLSGSPFSSAVNTLNRDLWFFNCSTDPERRIGSTVKVVPCLSGHNYSVVAATYDVEELHGPCLFIETVDVPDLWWNYVDGYEYYDGLTLQWDLPDCESCEMRGGTCGFKKNNGLDIGCSGAIGEGHGHSRGIRNGILTGIGVLAFLCLGGVIICFSNSQRQLQPTTGYAASTSRQPPVVALGLDGPTIESYPKTLLGESRRLPDPNHNTCSICLSDYQPDQS